MKLKYYLRGLGIGVAVMAVIWMIAGGAKESLTDEEIKERAKELGMVESVTLSQLEDVSEIPEDSLAEDESVSEESPSQASENFSEEDVSEGKSEETVNEETSEVDSQHENLEETSDVSENENASEGNNSSETISELSSEEDIDEYVIIEVGPGDGSGTVSAKLEAAGLVEDARMYDDFLCGNGYDKILQTGTHEIPRTADWDMIAEILAGRG